MTFREYIAEANIQNLSDEEEQQILSLVNSMWGRAKELTFANALQTLKPKMVKRNGLLLLKVGDINIKRRDTGKSKVLPIYIDYTEEDSAKAVAAFFPGTTPGAVGFIYVGNSLFKEGSKTQLISLLSHEVVHAVQHYRKKSSEYDIVSDKTYDEMTFEDWVSYYSEPIEKEALFTEMATMIKRQYSLLLPSSKNTEDINNYLSRHRQKFLLELKLFIQTPLENYVQYNELPLPGSFEKHHVFLELLLQRYDGKKVKNISHKTQIKLNDLRKEFRKKLISVYNNLQKV